MAGFKERLVLKPDYTLRALKRVAWDLDWDVVDLRREETGAFVDIWVTYDKQAEIHHVDDQPIGMRYVTVWGEEAKGVAEQIRQNCDVWTWREAQLALRAATDRNDKLAALYAVALAAPEAQNSSLVDDFRAITEDPDTGVRQAVIIATGYLPWLGLVKLVEELRDNDPDQQVRDNAQMMLDALSR